MNRTVIINDTDFLEFVAKSVVLRKLLERIDLIT